MTTPRKVFTDNDLQLARVLETISRRDLRNLLARLASSERKNKAGDDYDNFDCPHLAEDRCKCGKIQQELHEEYIEADKAWRIASGKDREGV